METITIARIERDGQALVIDPPFTLVVRETTVVSPGIEPIPYWEAVAIGEPVLGSEEADAALRQRRGTGWFAGRVLVPQALTQDRQDLEPMVVRQLWAWWDRATSGSTSLPPAVRAADEQLLKRMRVAEAAP